MKRSEKQRRRWSSGRRGLRILGWVFVFFWSAQLLGGVVLDYFWIRPRHPWMADMQERLATRNPPPEILFLGSSRFQGDINVVILDAELRRQMGERAPRTFNAALPAGDPTVFERVVDDLSRRGYVPKLAVIEVDPGTLAARDNWLRLHALNVLDWRDVPEAGPALCRNGHILPLVRGRLLALYLHRYHIRKEAAGLVTGLFGGSESAVAGSPASTPSQADRPLSSAPEKDPDPPAQTPQMRSAMEQGYGLVATEVKNYRIGGVASRRLERLLERFREAGVKVLLVGVPVSSPCRRAQTPGVNALFLAYMRQLQARYGCEFADWRDQVPDAYFVDMHHVSEPGGIYFSRRFAMSVLGPLWRNLDLRKNDATLVTHALSRPE